MFVQGGPGHRRMTARPVPRVVCAGVAVPDVVGLAWVPDRRTVQGRVDEATGETRAW